MDDRRVAEADMHGGHAVDALERPVQRREAIVRRRAGPRLHVGLIDLHNVGAGREQILDLRVDRLGVSKRRFGERGIEVVLRLLAHGERPGHGHLDLVVRVGAQEFEIVDFDRPLAPDRAYDARNRIGMARPVERHARLVDVDAFERGREAVRIAFATDFAVGDDVEPRVLLRPDREHGRIVLGLGEIRLRDAPELFRPNARRKAAGELGSIDEPFGLRI